LISLVFPYHFLSSLLGTFLGPGFPQSITVRCADGIGPGCAGDVDGITHRWQLTFSAGFAIAELDHITNLVVGLAFIIQPILDDLDAKLEIVFSSCY
jgi:hypothetical protein